MIHSPLFWLLLGQFSKWKRLGDGLHRSGNRLEFSDLLPYLIVIAVIIIGVAVANWLRHRYDLSQPCNDPRKLFMELCKAHHLDWPTRRLLHRLALSHELAQPAEVFLKPALFETGQLPPHLMKDATRLAALRQRLF